MKADDILDLAGRGRALDIDDEQRAERRLAELLAKAGVKSTARQRAAGQERARALQARQMIRRILVESLLFDGFENMIPARLRRTPAGGTTVSTLMELLERLGFSAAEQTVRRDIAEVNRQRAAKKSMP